MKHIFIIFLALASTFSVADMTVIEEAVETNGIRVEFSTASNRGFIYPVKCEQCTQDHYEFSEDIKISTKGKNVPLAMFLKQYRSAEFPTLLLDPSTLKVLRVIY